MTAVSNWKRRVTTLGIALLVAVAALTIWSRLTPWYAHRRLEQYLRHGIELGLAERALIHVGNWWARFGAYATGLLVLVFAVHAANRWSASRREG